MEISGWSNHAKGLADGHGPAPQVPPAGMHIIWLLVGDGHAEAPWFPEGTDPYGDMVEVDLDDEIRNAA